MQNDTRVRLACCCAVLMLGGCAGSSSTQEEAPGGATDPVGVSSPAGTAPSPGGNPVLTGDDSAGVVAPALDVDTSGIAGNFRLLVKDAPAEFQEVWVTITSAEAHLGTQAGMGAGGLRDGGAYAADDGEWIPIFQGIRRFDLLRLQDLATAVLGDATLAVGQYNRIRLRIEQAEVTMAGITQPVPVPPESKNAEVQVSLKLEDGGTYVVVVDIDVAKSLQYEGAELQMRPVMFTQMVGSVDQAGKLTTTYRTDPVRTNAGAIGPDDIKGYRGGGLDAGAEDGLGAHGSGPLDANNGQGPMGPGSKQPDDPYTVRDAGMGQGPGPVDDRNGDAAGAWPYAGRDAGMGQGPGPVGDRSDLGDASAAGNGNGGSVGDGDALGSPGKGTGSEADAKGASSETGSSNRDGGAPRSPGSPDGLPVMAQKDGAAGDRYGALAPPEDSGALAPTPTADAGSSSWTPPVVEPPSGDPVLAPGTDATPPSGSGGASGGPSGGATPSTSARR